jgi:glycine dehydrogenase subunit 1
MDYIPNTFENRKRMLEKIGVKDFSQLIQSIPPSILLKRELCLPQALSEMKLVKHLQELSFKNKSTQEMISFLGGGAYDHFIPSVVNHILSRSEFYTAYTPYQAEVSQGTLQSIYEYQSLICQLTGMDVSNASMYDGASALAEAALLAHTETQRDEVLVFNSVHPHYIQVLRTYTRGAGLKIKVGRTDEGLIDVDDLEKRISKKVACVIVQNPNFFGLIEEVEKIEPLVHSSDALLVMVCDPISLGLLKPPGEYGADLACGEGQSLGNPLNFGGPFLGYFAGKENLIRRMPGRIVGATTDTEGKRGFVMTLQTREQHIRREKATSNICTNEALCALASCVYLSLMGKSGLKKLAELCLQKSHYALEKITQIDGFSKKFSAPFFKEFVLQTPIPSKRIIKSLLKKNIFAGIDLSGYRLGFQNCLLISVTEKRTKEEIDYFVEQLKKLV